ncbi:MAG: hypothetical protein SGPRY_000653 [Prymnesium sp.]
MAAAVAGAEALARVTTAADNLVNRPIPLDQFKENLGSADYVRWRRDLVHLAESAGPDFRAALVTLRAIPAVAHYADASVVLDTAAGAPVLTMPQLRQQALLQVMQSLVHFLGQLSPFCAIAAEARVVTQQTDTTIADREEAWRAAILKAISSHVASGASRELIAGKCRHSMEAKLNADALNARCRLMYPPTHVVQTSVTGVDSSVPAFGVGAPPWDRVLATGVLCLFGRVGGAPPASVPAERSGFPVLDWVEGAVLSALPPVAASADTGAVVLGSLCLSRVWPRLLLFLPMLAPGEAVMVGEPLVISCSFSAAELCAVPAAVVGANAGHPSLGWASRHDVGTWVVDSGAEHMIGGSFLYPYSRVVAWSPEIFVKDVRGELTRVDVIVRTVVSLADGDHCVREVLDCDKFQIALWSCEYMSQFGLS